MIAITSDIDWAPDEVIEDTLSLLRANGVRATLFATHASPLLSGQESTQIEVGIHPNFEGRPPLQVLRELLALFPAARGVRSHGLMTSGWILQAFIACGLTHECNLFLPGQPLLRAYRLWSRLVRIPYFWDDAGHSMHDYPWSLDILPMEGEGLKVFNFHPIHLFLNTERYERYEAARPFLQQPERLREFRNPEQSGIGTRVFFQSLCEYVTRKGLPTFLLSEIANTVPR